jgi:sterol 3beta-glucosyltransferase
VQPYVALGVGLHAAGHTVTIATSARFHTFITERGLRHAPLTLDAMELMETPAGRAAVGGKGLLSLMRQLRPSMRKMLDEGWEAAQGADAIISNPKALSGYHVAEKLGVPLFLAHPVPVLAPTRAFAVPALPVSNLGGLVNKLSYQLATGAARGPFGGMVNAWRRDVLGLPPTRSERVLDGTPVPVLYAFSPHVVAPPVDWGDHVRVTGYWFLDHPATWQPDPKLVKFVAAGPAPVYIGFGSMASNDAAPTSQIVLEAIRRAGVRAVLATGVGGLIAENVPDNVFLLNEAPHDWLFGRMAAIVHHGGAGTTAAAFRAGKPQLVCPFFSDQPFWGQRVAALGVGPHPIKQKKLSVDHLTQALTTLTTDQAMHIRAAELGAHIRAEDGVARAVALINARLGVNVPQIEHAALVPVV